jgi:hypothetical protein
VLLEEPTAFPVNLKLTRRPGAELADVFGSLSVQKLKIRGILPLRASTYDCLSKPVVLVDSTHILAIYGTKITALRVTSVFSTGQNRTFDPQFRGWKAVLT